jgi:hypothetical protein
MMLAVGKQVAASQSPLAVSVPPRVKLPPLSSSFLHQGQAVGDWLPCPAALLRLTAALQC